ncbi:MAG: ABC transporter ATP-binding protein [Planctomycetaceae bacterium]|nr:ABC transporter ATP-binding protein [Planctomycetaceae bacterium]
MPQNPSASTEDANSAAAMRAKLDPQFYSKSQSDRSSKHAAYPLQTVVDLQGLGKKIKAKSILSDVTLQITNRVTGLLGPNGAGKSTLIKILLGLVAATDGTGKLLGLDIRREKLKIRQLVGYTPEDDCYIDGLTGVEMVQMSGQFFGLRGREALRRAHEVLDFCGIKQERYREISGYSTGMRQQVKFASAIVHNPQFLILDEPTTGLDPEERERLLRRVRFLNRQFGIGVMLSTHILPDVQLVCDDVIVLAEGRVRAHQSLASLQDVNRWRLQILEVNSAVALTFSQQLQHSGLRVDDAIDGGWELIVLDDKLWTKDRVVELIWRAAKNANATISCFSAAQESLEAIFLKAIGGTNHAHS